MKITAERIPEAQVVLDVELDEDRVRRSLNQASRRLAQRYRIPGFRKGRAPRAIVERTLGADLVFDEAAERLIPEAYDEAIAEQGLEPAGPPRLEITNRDPVRFRATVPLPPEVDLGDFRGISVPRPSVAVTEELVEDTLLELRRRHAVLEPVERPAAYNDRVRADVRAAVEEKEVLNEDSAEFFLREDGVVAVPGLVEQVLGMAPGDEREVDIDVPDDWEDEEVAGKTVHFTVRLHDIKQEILPEPDDDLAGEVGDFETFAEMRTQVEKDLREGAERRARDEFHEAIIEAIGERASLEFPPTLVEHEIEHVLQDRARQLGLTPEALAQQAGGSLAPMREALQPDAVERVRRGLILAEAAKALEIDITDADIDAEIARIAGDTPNADEVRAVFDNEAGRNAIRQNLVTTRTLERLGEIAAANAEQAAREPGPGDAGDTAQEPASADDQGESSSPVDALDTESASPAGAE